MRPIPHAPLTPPFDTSSRHAIDAVVAGDPMPVGIPALFITDQLARGRSTEEVLGGSRGLIAEYAGAEGYAFRWGQLIELRLGRYVLWRVIPVAMWNRVAEQRSASPLLIEDLLTLVQAGIPSALRRRLPHDVLLVGCHGPSRRSPHTLFALLLADPAAIASVRQWLAMPFLTDVLPRLLSSVESRLTDLVRGISR